MRKAILVGLTVLLLAFLCAEAQAIDKNILERTVSNMVNSTMREPFEAKYEVEGFEVLAIVHVEEIKGVFTYFGFHLLRGQERLAFVGRVLIEDALPEDYIPPWEGILIYEVRKEDSI